MNVMIFAAGFGTRMQPLTHRLPKALVQVAGRPLIDHALAQARAVKPDRIVVNGHHHVDQLKTYLAQDPDVIFCEEPKYPLETGGGLRAALPHLGPEPVMTFNSDAVWQGPKAADMLTAAWNPMKMDVLLLLVHPERVSGAPGGWRLRKDAEGRLSYDATDGFAYTGAAIYQTGSLLSIEDDVFSLRKLWEQKMAVGRVFGTVYPGHWADVGTVEGIALAEAMLEQHKTL